MVFLDAYFTLLCLSSFGISVAQWVPFSGEITLIVVMLSSAYCLLFNIPFTLCGSRVSSSSSTINDIGVLVLVCLWWIVLVVRMIPGAVMSTEVDVGTTL